jgi:hypothetical protein
VVAIGRDDRAVAVEHVIEEHAVIGLVDADGRLHCLGGQADLVTFDGKSARQLELGPGALDCIGVLDREVRMLQREHADQPLGAFGLVETLCELRDPLWLKHDPAPRRSRDC